MGLQSFFKSCPSVWTESFPPGVLLLVLPSFLAISLVIAASSQILRCFFFHLATFFTRFYTHLLKYPLLASYVQHKLLYLCFVLLSVRISAIKPWRATLIFFFRKPESECSVFFFNIFRIMLECFEDEGNNLISSLLVIRFQLYPFRPPPLVYHCVLSFWCEGFWLRGRSIWLIA